MELKSLAEIAFDAFQAIDSSGRQYTADGNKVKFGNLPFSEKRVWELVANRVYAEVLLRQNPDQKEVAMPNLDKGKK